MGRRAGDPGPELADPVAPVSAGKTAKARCCDTLQDVLGVEVAALVALAVESEDCVGTGVHSAMDAASQVHAKERKSRIGNGVDEAAHQGLALRDEVVVLTAEWDD